MLDNLSLDLRRRVRGQLAPELLRRLVKHIGRRQPTWASALAIAKALGVSVAAFAEEGDAPAQTPKSGRPRKGGK